MTKITNKKMINKIERLITWTLGFVGYCLQYPVHIDVGDENMPPDLAGGIGYDDEHQKWLLMFNATTPWWFDGQEPLLAKAMRTVRHELRHLFQREYLKACGFDDDIINYLMSDDLWGGYENNPYEWDAHKFEDSDQSFNEGLDWIDQVIAH